MDFSVSRDSRAVAAAGPAAHSRHSRSVSRLAARRRGGLRGCALAILMIELVAVGLAGTARADVSEVSAGSITYHFDSIRGATPAERERKRRYFHKRKCKVVGLYGRKRKFFERVAAHIHWVLTDEAFAALVMGKLDWTGTDHEPARILTALRAEPERVIVNLFGRDEDMPCRTRKADGHTNAFAASLGTERIFFIYDEYLEEQLFAPEPDKGVRTMARTVIHETLHVIGYRHVDPETKARYPVGSALYNNSVPAYIGCLVMNWSDDPMERLRIGDTCALPSAEQERSRFAWKCPSPRRFRTGEQVEFKASSGWLQGTVIKRYKHGFVDIQGRKHVFEGVSPCRLRAPAEP